MWYVGQQVICINDIFPKGIFDWCEAIPVAGYVYTVRGVSSQARDYSTGLPGVGLHLAEVVNPTTSTGLEAYFCAGRFVPFVPEAVQEHYVAEMQNQSCSRSQTEGLGTHFRGAIPLRGGAGQSAAVFRVSGTPNRPRPRSGASTISVSVPNPQFGNEE